MEAGRKGLPKMFRRKAHCQCSPPAAKPRCSATSAKTAVQVIEAAELLVVYHAARVTECRKCASRHAFPPTRTRSRAEGDKSIATLKPGPRCVALQVLADTSVDVTAAPKHGNTNLPRCVRPEQATLKNQPKIEPAADL